MLVKAKMIKKDACLCAANIYISASSSNHNRLLAGLAIHWGGSTRHRQLPAEVKQCEKQCETYRNIVRPCETKIDTERFWQCGPMWTHLPGGSPWRDSHLAAGGRSQSICETDIQILGSSAQYSEIFWDNGDNGDSHHWVMSAYCEHYLHRIGNTLGGCSTSQWLLGFRPAKDQQIAHLQWKRIRDLGSSKSGQRKKLSTASSLKSFKAQISETNQTWQSVPVNSTQFRMLKKRE